MGSWTTQSLLKKDPTEFIPELIRGIVFYKAGTSALKYEGIKKTKP